MSTRIPRIEFPELFVGFVAPIGADLDETISAFREHFENKKYRVVEIKVTDIFEVLKKYVEPKERLTKETPFKRYVSYIAYGNQLRESFDDDILACIAVNLIAAKRVRLSTDFENTVYFIRQFKRKEEIDLLRSVYKQAFFQVSIYSRRGARIDHLSRVFAKGEHSSFVQSFRSKAEELCQKDENEIEEPHGQRVGTIFHDADFIVSLDAQNVAVTAQVSRFCDLLFSSNAISPTAMEYGLYLAKAAALRTLDLSRQVGAAIFSENGQIVALGSNEVPKASGGTYWANEEWDDRDFRRGYDSNYHRKREILGELAQSLGHREPIDNILRIKEIRDSQFMDVLEYGRIVHAEMNAISDAARGGRSTNKSTLYCTTFPCHMCAKHIIASGIARVVFLEPYPKSLASELHRDSISVEQGDRGSYNEFPYVSFEHFFGISPRRYRELFERTKRKDDNGNFVAFGTGHPVPNVDLKFPFYQQLERFIIDGLSELLAQAINDQEKQPSNPQVENPRRSSTQRAKRRRRVSS